MQALGITPPPPPGSSSMPATRTGATTTRATGSSESEVKVGHVHSTTPTAAGSLATAAPPTEGNVMPKGLRSAEKGMETGGDRDKGLKASKPTRFGWQRGKEVKVMQTFPDSDPTLRAFGQRSKPQNDEDEPELPYGKGTWKRYGQPI